MPITPVPIRIILADDHIRTHEAVALLLKDVPDMQLIGQASNGQEAYELCEQHQPDIVLMDVMMAVMNGIEATQKIHQRFPAIKILVLSSFQDDESVLAMLRSGAVGYVLKGSLASELVNTLRAVSTGQNVFSPAITQKLLQPNPQTATYGLTEREQAVLRLMAAGLTNQQVGQQLFISASTVKFHLANILNKMNVETRSEAIVLAVKMGIV